MNVRNNKSGFTLLEIIIVIIIVGVLASLALPRFFSTVEFSKSSEALTAISTLRQSIERCYLSTNNYTTCTNLAQLDVENPGSTPGARFSYAVSGATATGGFTLTATRNATDGGDGTSTIVVQYPTAGAVVRSGTGKFIGIK